MNVQEAIENSLPFLEILARDLEKPLEEVIVEFEKNYKRLASSPAAKVLTPILLLKRAQVDTEDSLCVEVTGGTALEGVITGVIANLDGNGRKLREIRNAIKVPKKLEQLKKDGIVKEIDGKDVIIDKMKHFPNTDIENPNYDKPLMPNWRMTVVGYGAIEEKPEEIKEFLLTVYDTLANPSSPNCIESLIRDNVGVPIKITGLFPQKKGASENLLTLGANDPATVKVLPAEGGMQIENMAVFTLSMQATNRVFPDKRFSTLSQKENWYKVYGLEKGKEAFNEWTFLGNADDPTTLRGVRIVRIRLGEEGKFSSIDVRDDTLKREANSYERISIPPQVRIRDVDGTPLLSKGSEILPVVKVRRRNRVYNEETGQWEKGEGAIFYQLIGFTTLFSTGPTRESKPEEVSYQDVDLDEI